jgi:Mrp family chromosome partitioning ATPase
MPDPASDGAPAVAETDDSVEAVVSPPPAEPMPPPEPLAVADIISEAAPAQPIVDSATELEHYLAPSGDLIPAFEVERFDWPQTVTALAKNSSQLGALIGELLPDGRGTLIVSGCRRGEGRTSVALVLARHLGRNGVRVALVDADVEQPELAARLSVLVEAGWETSLAGELPPGEALIESLRDRLTLVPLMRPISASQASGAGPCLKQLIERLQAEFEVVCIDAGPLAESGETSHATLFGRTQIDAAVIVHDVRHVRPEQTHAVGRKLAQLGVSRWAVVENFCGVGAPAV